MKQWPLEKTQYDAEPASSKDFSFGGFKNLNSTPIPDEFFDVLAVRLSEAELRVLLYIMRRTFGFKKRADAISLSQLTGGIRKRDGSVLDHGTGLSKPAVLKAVTGLQAKGIISIEKRTGEDGRNEVNVYQLRFADELTANSQAEYSSNKYNSNDDYSEHKQIPGFTPDPRFVAARPVTPLNGWQPSEQRQNGDFPLKRLENFGQNSESGSGVNRLYREGKQSLPGSKNQPEGGKPALPGGVNKNNQAGQTVEATGVNRLYQQHGSQQDSRKQQKSTQSVWETKGALAYQPVLPNEPTGLALHSQQLYINPEELTGAMYELGLSQKLVFDLLQTYPAEYLWEKVELTRRQLQGHQPTIKNTAGYLRRAISEDYRPLPAKSQQNLRPNASDFAGRFQGTLAYLHRNRPGVAPGDDNYPVDNYADPGLDLLLEDIYPEEIAPPLLQQDFNSQIGSGGLRPEIPPNPSLPGQEVNARHGGVVGVQEDPAFSRYGYLDPTEAAATGLWEKIYEDLEGRFRLGDALELLKGALLFLPDPDDCENRVTLQLPAPWQERALGLAARSAIALAVRQRLGPGFKVNFCSA